MADFAAFDILGSSPSDAGRTPSPHSWSSYSPPGSVESMLTVPDFAPPPPAVFFHQHHQSSHPDLYNGSAAAAYWPGTHSSLSAAGPVPLPGRSFLGPDMYDDKEQGHGSSHLKSHDGSMYISPPGSVFRADWELGGSVGNSSAESSPSVHNLAAPPAASPAPSAGAQDAQPYYRRASYPYARHDESVYHSSPRNDGPIYAEPLPIEHSQQPLAADPAHLHARPLEESQYVQQHPQHSHHHHNPHHQPQHHHHAHAAHTHAHQHPDEVKIENSNNGMQYYRPQHQQSAPTGPPPSQSIPAVGATTYMTHAGGIPIMHTDDAASKETQYLRRRCFNCHTTEPPSWRRSTLNPGKIVCNKCGLYERTHLRPRPHRFDELRATSKARKAASKGAAPSPQPMVQQHHMIPHQPQPQQPQAISQQQVPQHVPSPSLSPKSQQGGYVKKEPGDEYDIRRASVGSVGSSNVNGAEWDPSVSGVHRLSQSPPSSHAAGPIRLPSLPGGSMGSRTPEAQRPYFDRRSSMPGSLDGARVDTPPPAQQQSPQQQWQGATMSVADLVEDDKSRTPN